MSSFSRRSSEDLNAQYRTRGARDPAQHGRGRAHLRGDGGEAPSRQAARLGFDISDKAVKRCGLDYWPLVDLTVYESLDEYFEKNGEDNLFLATTKAPRAYSEADLSAGNVTLMFGKETAGLPLWLREKYRENCIRIPMISEARSLNLSNSVAILAYETLRQQGFPGLQGFGEMAQT